MTLLSALGLSLSAYLGWHHLTGGAVIGCDGASACDQVLSSRWSAVGGVLPVSGLAAGTYLAMLIASFFIGPDTPTAERRLAWGAMLVLSAAAAGSAVWFTIVQKWMVGALCPYCMATHIIGVLLAWLILWRAPMERDASGDHVPRRIIPARPAAGQALIGFALAGTLAASQILFKPPPAYRGGEAQNNRLAIDPHTVPLVGSPDAPYIVNLMFDYKCPHCQLVHSMLDEVIRRYDGKLAFALCPVPMNIRCNPYIPREIEEFKDSCELTQVALALWVADRQAFAAFDRWIFSTEPGEHWKARGLDAAKAKAVELIGQTRLDAALADPWIGRYMQTCVQLFGNTTHSSKGGNAVPKLVFGSRWVTPQPHDANELISILHDALAVPSP